MKKEMAPCDGAFRGKIARVQDNCMRPRKDSAREGACILTRGTSPILFQWNRIGCVSLR